MVSSNDKENDSNQSQTEIFNGFDFLENILKGSKAALGYRESISFPPGLQYIMHDFALKIAQLNIRITNVEYRMGEIKIDFSMLKIRGEVLAWRAVELVREQSHVTCVVCGNGGIRKMRGENLTVMCRMCEKAEENNGITGTWLDKY